MNHEQAEIEELPKPAFSIINKAIASAKRAPSKEENLNQFFKVGGEEI